MHEIEIAVLLNDHGEIGPVRAEDIHVEDDHLGTVKITFSTDGSLTGATATVTEGGGERVTYTWDAVP